MRLNRVECEQWRAIEPGFRYFEVCNPFEVPAVDGGKVRLESGTVGACLRSRMGPVVELLFFPLWKSWTDMVKDKKWDKEEIEGTIGGYAEPGDVYIFERIEGYGGRQEARKFLPSGFVETYEG